MWQPIDTAPRDRRIILYWPLYSYSGDVKNDTATDVIEFGRWKTNFRLRRDGRSKAELEDLQGYAESYFSDNDGGDDYGLALQQFAPTHWMPEPPSPTGDSEGSAMTASAPSAVTEMSWKNLRPPEA